MIDLSTRDPSILCPMCGSANDAPCDACSVCGYALGGAPNNAGGLKCARCGSEVPSGYAYCPVCGLDQRNRLARPPTRVVQLEDEEDTDDGTGPPPGIFGSEVPAYSEPYAAYAVTPQLGGYASVGPFHHEPAPEVVTPAKTGRTHFVDGAPVPRPPSFNEDDRTVPVPGRSSRRPSLQPSGPFLPRPSEGSGEGDRSGHGPDARDPVREPHGSGRLVLVGRDGEEGESYPLLRDALEIGRTHGDIRFAQDRFMSPAHARIERTAEGYRLVDTGSLNGVFVRIRGHAPVYPSDQFMVGHQVLRLENVVEAVQEQAPAPDGTRTFGTPLKPAWGKLVLVGRGAVAGDTYYLRGAKVIFGRELGDILFPHDPFVSREHARLRLELHGQQMAVFLEDLGSANGTYVRVRGSTEIRPRDTFRVGDQILRLRLDS